MGAALMAIRRRRERREMSLKSLVQAAELVASRAATAVATPSIEHAIALGQIAGATSAVRWITDQGRVNVNFSASPEFRRQMKAWAGERIAKLAPGLMAASDGQPQTLLLNGAASELRANAEAVKPVALATRHRVPRAHRDHLVGMHRHDRQPRIEQPLDQ
jgi:hypothetical protein